MSEKRAPYGGLQGIVDMLHFLDGDHRDRLLKNLAEKDPHLARQIEKKLVRFEDLAKLGASEIQNLVRQIPQSKLALALRGAPREFIETILSHLPKRSSESLRDELRLQGPKLLSQIEKARAEILKSAEDLGILRRG